MRCIAKEPNERFSTMDELLQAIRRAHGGSMTGQLAAMPVHGTGPYSVNNTGPPPPLAGWHPTPVSIPPVAPLPTFVQPAPMRPIYRSTPPAPGVTGSHTGMGMIRSEHAADYSGVVEAKPRSKIWVLFGVLVAAGVGGGLGMLAFHWTAPKAPDPVPVPATSPSPSASASPSASSASSPSSSSSVAPPTSASATTADPKGTTVHFVTDPPGATVKENGKELCAPTPCEVTFKGDDATRTHKISIEEKGFKSETKSVKPIAVTGGADAAARAIDVKLTKSPAPGPKPTPKPEASTPSGFKDAY